MSGARQDGGHAAEAAALGFYYQTFFALLTLLKQDTDDATVSIEQLDDVELKADGQTLLFQLKHSMKTFPPPISIKSRSLWRTIKVWIDALPNLSLSETSLHLVTVGGIDDESPLVALLTVEADRTSLVTALSAEAQRVVDERIAAKAKNQPLPHSDRVDGCEAFLGLAGVTRQNLLRRIIIKKDYPSIDAIEDLIADRLKILMVERRKPVAQRLTEWWDRQMVYSLCGKRDRVISRAELQESITSIIGDIEQDRILPDFETVFPPQDYQPDGILARQIELVKGHRSDLRKAIREEWRAREQRSKWISDKLSMASVIGGYDLLLKEHWSDRHERMREDCTELEEDEKCAAGLDILRWTHDKAPAEIRPIADGWNATYYVRGSYQVLAIDLEVGWHPDWDARLGKKA